MFNIGELVRHKITGYVYTILELPTENQELYYVTMDCQYYWMRPDEIEGMFEDNTKKVQDECKCCNGKEDIPSSNDNFSIGIENNELEIFYQNPDNFHNHPSTKIKINYCPRCGRNLLLKKDTN